MEDYDNIETLDGLTVVAARGDGVWVCNEDGDCWCLVGDNYCQDKDNALTEVYEEAFDE